MRPTALVVMGVSGAGKSTVASLLAEHLDRPLVEGDDLQPPEALRRAAAGLPLTDAERTSWLEAIRDGIDTHTDAGLHTVVSCSALKRSYRDVLRQARARVRFILLDGSEEVLTERLGERGAGPDGRRPPPAVPLADQLRELEPLEPDEDGITIPVSGIPVETMAAALTALGLRPG